MKYVLCIFTLCWFLFATGAEAVGQGGSEEQGDLECAYMVAAFELSELVVKHRDELPQFGGGRRNVASLTEDHPVVLKECELERLRVLMKEKYEVTLKSVTSIVREMP